MWLPKPCRRRPLLSIRLLISKLPIGAGVTIILAVLLMTWTVREGVTQVNGATSDETLTAEQCINGNTATSIEPAEERELIRAGIIESRLDEIKITKYVCKEIIDRTPVERAVAAVSITIGSRFGPPSLCRSPL
jgi:hypothetical protein